MASHVPFRCDVASPVGNGRLFHFDIITVGLVILRWWVCFFPVHDVVVVSVVWLLLLKFPPCIGSLFCCRCRRSVSTRVVGGAMMFWA